MYRACFILNLNGESSAYGHVFNLLQKMKLA